MKPFSLEWWKERWVEATSIHDMAYLAGDEENAMRHGKLAQWIDERINRHKKSLSNAEELLREVHNIWCPENAIERDVYNKIDNYLKDNGYD